MPDTVANLVQRGRALPRRARDKKNAQPPAHLLPQMAQVLGVGADVLLGMAQPRKVKRLATNSLERRLLAIEKLDPKAKRQITQLLDTFIEREKLKQRVNAQGA